VCAYQCLQRRDRVVGQKVALCKAGPGQLEILFDRRVVRRKLQIVIGTHGEYDVQQGQTVRSDVLAGNTSRFAGARVQTVGQRDDLVPRDNIETEEASEVIA
jgi:hypothetical protein